MCKVWMVTMNNSSWYFPKAHTECPGLKLIPWTNEIQQMSEAVTFEFVAHPVLSVELGFMWW